MAYVDDVFDELVSESANIDSGDDDQEFDTSMNTTGIALEEPEKIVDDLINNLRKESSESDYSIPVAKDDDTMDTDPDTIKGGELPDGSDSDIQEFSIGAMLPQVGSTDGSGDDVEILYKKLNIPEELSIDDFRESVITIFGQNVDNSYMEESARDSIHRANITYGPKIHDELDAANKALVENDFNSSRTHAKKAKEFTADFKNEVNDAESDNYDLLLGFSKYICGNIYVETGKYADGGLTGIALSTYLTVASAKHKVKAFKGNSTNAMMHFSKKYSDKKKKEFVKNMHDQENKKIAKDKKLENLFRSSVPGKSDEDYKDAVKEFNGVVSKIKFLGKSVVVVWNWAVSLLSVFSLLSTSAKNLAKLASSIIKKKKSNQPITKEDCNMMKVQILDYISRLDKSIDSLLVGIDKRENQLKQMYSVKESMEEENEAEDVVLESVEGEEKPMLYKQFIKPEYAHKSEKVSNEDIQSFTEETMDEYTRLSDFGNTMGLNRNLESKANYLTDYIKRLEKELEGIPEEEKAKREHAERLIKEKKKELVSLETKIAAKHMSASTKSRFAYASAKLEPTFGDLFFEAADISIEMKPIIEELNKKGYKTKYSSPGYVDETKTGDRNDDQVYYGKLYSSARLMFDEKYDFGSLPKFWEMKTVDGKSYLDVIEPNKKDNTVSGKDQFEQWKNRYMSSLKLWADKLPERKDEAKEMEEAFNDFCEGMFGSIFNS